MSIRKRHDRWEVRLRLGGGRRIERTLRPGATRDDALHLEAKLRLEAAKVDAGRAPRRLIADAIDQWVATEARLLKSWEGNLRYRVDIVKEAAAGRYLDEIPAVATALKRSGANAKPPLKPATINRHLAVLRRVGNLAVAWGWTDVALGKKVGMLGGEEARHVYLTREQVRALMAECEPEAADAIVFAALTGLRRSEMLGLQRSNLVDGAVVLTARTKSGRPRTVPMPPEAARIAARRVPWAIEAWRLREAWERARKAAKLPGVQFRDLRHTFASWLVQGGENLAVVRDLLGHSSLAVTSRYSHLARPDLARATASLRVGAGRGPAKRR